MIFGSLLVKRFYNINNTGKRNAIDSNHKHQDDLSGRIAQSKNCCVNLFFSGLYLLEERRHLIICTANCDKQAIPAVVRCKKNSSWADTF